MPCIDKFFDAFNDSWAQPRYAFKLALTSELFDVAIEGTDCTGGIFVGTRLKRIAALFQCKQYRDLFQNTGDLIFVHTIYFLLLARLFRLSANRKTRVAVWSLQKDCVP